MHLMELIGPPTHDNQEKHFVFNFIFSYGFICCYVDYIFFVGRSTRRRLSIFPTSDFIFLFCFHLSELETEDKLEYTFHPVSGKEINFKVRAAHDAHLALTTGDAESEPMLEIFIGGWKNTKSVIRKNRAKPDVCEVETPDILNAGEFRGFWIKWLDDVSCPM